ncbi:phospho-N-acetylmuramoyl-pentapeptide-transferase [Hydrogenivirga caldilitoris]|uniref:Phospho-N-acetylmuramoyl-pentapeptide-transferase n=1 Tax=Hydrogenivirga caldilitoris TaxID=246264 RepID=A0A497XT73_9AQUI|nr:phospho-N-acetylmuramoyl-pentapeptide-transferase [Hydrogenivirga caldilitoris]RLJ71370.1 phospho-N-acetylmuramoyl-pentapeptide-transferase [Hydrogenivirga caldilitoris]
MLYHLALLLKEHFFLFNVFKYITFRSFTAILLAFFITLLLSPTFMRRFESVQRLLGGYVREYTPQHHENKKYTPTMGGIVIITVILLSSVLLMRLDIKYTWVLVFATLSFALIGLVDDWKKLKDKKGLSIKVKLLSQVISAFVISILIFHWVDLETKLYFPFFKELTVDLGWLYIPFAMFVIVGTANAVNLTDGLDGLAIGPSMTTATAFGVIAYVVGHSKIAQYLGVPHVPYAGEMTVFCFAIIGAGLGFLWFNAYPAQVFMGDVGALGLGAALATTSILAKSEFLLAVAGGVFVFETVTVILQIIYFRATGGKRLFKKAPFHHHLEEQGLDEPKIVVRMWIISALLAIVSVAMLKLR